MSESKVFKAPVTPSFGDRVLTNGDTSTRFQGYVRAHFRDAYGDPFVVVELYNAQGVFQVVSPSVLYRVTDDHTNKETRMEKYTEQSDV